MKRIAFVAPANRVLASPYTQDPLVHLMMRLPEPSLAAPGNLPTDATGDEVSQLQQRPSFAARSWPFWNFG